MTTFKDIHGQTLFEVTERSTRKQATSYARRYNESHSRKVAEIDYHDGRYDFINDWSTALV